MQAARSSDGAPKFCPKDVVELKMLSRGILAGFHRKRGLCGMCNELHEQLRVPSVALLL